MYRSSASLIPIIHLCIFAKSFWPRLDSCLAGNKESAAFSKAMTN